MNKVKNTIPQKYPYVTWASVKKKHPDSWVFMINPKVKNNSFLGGELVFTAKKRETLTKKIAQFVAENKPKSITVRWTGIVDY